MGNWADSRVLSLVTPAGSSDKGNSRPTRRTPAAWRIQNVAELMGNGPIRSPLE